MSKILILGKLPPPYFGPAIATEIILNSKLREHFNILHFDTGLNSSIEELGRFRIAKIFKNFRLYYDFYTLIKMNKPELILIPVSQTTMGFLKDSIYILISKTIRCKITLHLRGSSFRTWYDQSGFVTKYYTRVLLKKCNGVIVLGSKLKSIFKDLIEGKNIFVVPNGANYNLPAKLEYDGKLRILYIGNYLRSKGIDTVLRALQKLNVNSKSLIFNGYGKWDDEKYKLYCNSLVSNIKFEVNLNNPISGEAKFQALINSDLFIFTPNSPEGHPWVIVEAMAAGLPIISTDQGAITESVIDQINGFIVDPHNADSITEKLNSLIIEKDLRIKMGNASRKLYEENFTEETMVQNLHNVFNSILTDDTLHRQIKNNQRQSF